jgi:hypothetical protein
MTIEKEKSNCSPIATVCLLTQGEHRWVVFIRGSSPKPLL